MFQLDDSCHGSVLGMSECMTPTPRWGSEGRDRKAAAIWLTMVRHCGEDIASGTWLDVGCGSGGIAATLASRVNRIIGVDPEPWEEWHIATATHENLSFHASVFDEVELPVACGSIDVVVCNQVYEHVNNPIALLRNIHSVLKPGGFCYFAGPNLLWPIEPHVYWPFVHWLPRPSAQRFMRMLGSKQADDLDAFSVSYWRLRAWFKVTDFRYEDAVPARLAAGLTLGGHNHLAKLTDKLPNGLLLAIAPFYPGFVFLLRRPDNSIKTFDSSGCSP